MTQGSFSLGKVFGIPVLVHWSVVLVIVMFGDSLAQQYGWVAASVALVAFLASILAHEFAHALVARRHSVNTISIQLWALGGVARLDREAPTARAEGWIAVAGPITSLVLGVAALGAFFGLDALGVDRAGLGALGWIGLINTALAVFNMLPGSPLDGGRVLKAWRWGRHGDRFRAAREASNAGKAIGFSMAGVGGVIVLNGHSGLILVITGLFIAVSAKTEHIAADMAERLQGVRIRDLTWFGVAHATTDTDADTMLWQRSRLGEAGMVAIERADGELAGIVTEEQLLAVPEWRRPTVLLASLMVPMNQIAHAQLDEELANVLPRLSAKAPFVTVWREGKLLGVVPRRRLLGRLKAAQS